MRYSWLLIVALVAMIGIVVLSFLRHRNKKQQKKKSQAVLLSHTRKIKNLPAYTAARRRYRTLLILTAIFFVTSIVSMTILAARPVTVSQLEQNNESRDIMLCIDVSGSMTSELNSVMSEYISILNQLKGERVGITLFATYSVLLAPLTNDYDSLMEILREIQTNYNNPYRYSAGSDFYIYYYSPLIGAASFIGDGVINCINNLGNLGSDTRYQSVIIATDNMQTVGSEEVPMVADITQAANYAKSNNVTLYGINTYGGGSGGTYYTSSDNAINTYMRAVTSTGGLYFKVENNGQRESSANHIVKAILDDEAALHAGARQYIQYDSPMIPAIIALLSIAVLGILIWRLQL